MRMPRLLILSCSKAKRKNAGCLPAIERYDGPTFRVLRRYLRQPGADPPETYVLSAKFGLIPGDCRIPDYDRSMTPQRAEELRPQVIDDLHRIPVPAVPSDSPMPSLFHNLGKVYLLATGDLETIMSDRWVVSHASGPPGVKLSQLHHWLYGDLPPSSKPHPAGTKPQAVRIGGVTLAMTSSEALAAGRCALARDEGKPEAFSTWYVDLDGRRVAPKWLVSVLTDLPVSAFTTGQARSALERLGVEVHHT
jgi:hypothetical protein